MCLICFLKQFSICFFFQDIKLVYFLRFFNNFDILIKKYFYKITHYQTKLFKKNNPNYIYINRAFSLGWCFVFWVSEVCWHIFLIVIEKARKGKRGSLFLCLR